MKNKVSVFQGVVRINCVRFHEVSKSAVVFYIGCVIKYPKIDSYSKDTIYLTTDLREDEKPSSITFKGYKDDKWLMVAHEGRNNVTVALLKVPPEAFHQIWESDCE